VHLKLPNLSPSLKKLKNKTNAANAKNKFGIEEEEEIVINLNLLL